MMQLVYYVKVDAYSILLGILLRGIGKTLSYRNEKTQYQSKLYSLLC